MMFEPGTKYVVTFSTDHDARPSLAYSYASMEKSTLVSKQTLKINVYMFDIDKQLLKASRAKPGAFELLANIIPQQSCNASTLAAASFSASGDFYQLAA